MRYPTRRPSSAVVISSLALIVALTGTGVATAAVDLAKKSVGAKHLKNNAVRSKHIKKQSVKASDIKAGAVKSSKIRDSAVTGAKVQDGSLTGADIADGSVTKDDLAPGVLPTRTGVSAHATVDMYGPTLLDNAVGITAVERVSTGRYCLTLAAGVPTTDTNAVASPEWSNSLGVEFVVMPSRAGCGEGKLSVLTFTTEGAATNDAAFSVIIP